MIVYSVIVPQREAGPALARLLPELCSVLDGMGRPYEVVAVDAGSSASSLRALVEQLPVYPALRVLCFAAPTHYTLALSAGIAAARGEQVLAWDATGRYQNTDIPRLIERLSRADAVFGCRRARWLPRLARACNRSLCTLVRRGEIRDSGCRVWAARREALENLPIRAGQHRHLASLIARRGFRVSELHVEHQHARLAQAFERDRLSEICRGWWPRQHSATVMVTELFAAGQAPAVERRFRIDPPQPLNPSSKQQSKPSPRDPREAA